MNRSVRAPVRLELTLLFSPDAAVNVLKHYVIRLTCTLMYQVLSAHNSQLMQTSNID